MQVAHATHTDKNPRPPAKMQPTEYTHADELSRAAVNGDRRPEESSQAVVRGSWSLRRPITAFGACLTAGQTRSRGLPGRPEPNQRSTPRVRARAVPQAAASAAAGHGALACTRCRSTTCTPHTPRRSPPLRLSSCTRHSFRSCHAWTPRLSPCSALTHTHHIGTSWAGQTSAPALWAAVPGA